MSAITLIRVTTSVVATLALGLRPRQGFIKVQAKSEAASHISYF
jgi:hypothetical protein